MLTQSAMSNDAIIIARHTVCDALNKTYVVLTGHRLTSSFLGDSSQSKEAPRSPSPEYYCASEIDQPGRHLHLMETKESVLLLGASVALLDLFGGRCPSVSGDIRPQWLPGVLHNRLVFRQTAEEVPPGENPFEHQAKRICRLVHKVFGAEYQCSGLIDLERISENGADVTEDCFATIVKRIENHLRSFCGGAQR